MVVVEIVVVLEKEGLEVIRDLLHFLFLKNNNRYSKKNPS